MSASTVNPNGTYTKFPNVTFELFDIFNLLDSERCFFMWFFKEYHHRSPYIGSLRDLTKLTGRSKSNVDRIIKRLGETGLLKVSTEGKQTIIEVEELALWAWNRVASMEQIVPTTGHIVPSVGRYVPTTGQCVPQMGQQGHVNEHEKPIHMVGINSNKDINKTNKERTNTPSVIPSSDASKSSAEKAIPFTIEEKTLLAWLKEDDVITSNDNDKVKTQLQKLLPLAKTKEEAHDHFLFVQKMVSGRENPTVSLGNMVEDVVLNTLRQAKKQEPEQEPVAAPQEEEIGLSKEDFDYITQEIAQYCPGLITAYQEVDGRYSIGIDRNGQDWIDILRPTDWKNLPQLILNEAMEYGAAMRLQVAI